MPTLPLADLLVLAAYVLIVLAVGAWAARKQQGPDAYFLANRDLPWLLVGISILATAFSAASLLGGPGEAYAHGLLWLQLQLGDLVAIALVALVFIPALRGRDLTTAYEFLEERFDHRVRAVASALFIGQVLFRTGILIYGPALALATITGVDVRWAIIAVGIVATIYTVLGGITAVIWTDALQLVVVVGGLLACVVILATETAGGLTAALAVASEAGRTRVVDPDQAWTSVRSLPGAVIGYGLLALSVAGTNQQSVQRYLTCRDVRGAQRAAWTGWVVGLVVTALTLLVGVLLFAFYRGQDPAVVGDLGPDAVFPHFIGTALPTGLAGLLVAAIFAAAMSSLDSALNSLATATMHDFVGRYRRSPLAGGGILRWSRGLTIAWGVLAIAAALYVAGQGTLLAMAVRYMGYFAGPVLGVFVLALWPRRVRSGAALIGASVGFGGVLAYEGLTAAQPGWPGLGIWACGVGLVLTVSVALVAGAWRPTTRNGDQAT